MRISTSTIYDSGVGTMQQQTERLLQVQRQIASNRRMLTPADDPVAAAQALQVSQSQSINTQYGINAGTASDSLGLEESVLGNVYSLLQQVRDVINNAGNPTLGASDRAILANDLRGSYQQLLGLANSTDGSGQYLFSGYQGGTRPFGETAPGVVAYYGDQGQRLVQVGSSRQIAVSDAGADVFQRVPTGNGSFAAQAGGANTGLGVIDAGTVLNPVTWNAVANPRDFTIKFAGAASPLTYDIVDNVSGNSLLTGLAAGLPPYARSFSSVGSIGFKSQGTEPAFDFGVTATIDGTPNAGDTFTLKASTNQDVFKTIDGLANLLQSTPGGTALTNGLAIAQRNLDNAMESVSTARASAGARLKELDAVKNAGEDRGLQYSQTLSRLQDLDYAKAASELTQQQVSLQAAQKSFAKIAGLSLFDYL